MGSVVGDVKAECCVRTLPDEGAPTVVTDTLETLEPLKRLKRLCQASLIPEVLRYSSDTLSGRGW